MSDTQEKIALVTGTSTGIGLSTAIQLAQNGFSVIATMRDTAKATDLESRMRTAGVSIDVRQLDVQDDASVTSCIQDVLKTYGRIDLLVNNAGAGHLATMEQTSMTALHNTMDTNFFGVWRVTQAVFPAMRAAGTGRIITVTSIGGIIGQPFNDAYCAAKFAVEGFMESLAPIARNFGIAVSIIEPGPVNTNFVASVTATRPEPTPELQEIYDPMFQVYVGDAQARFASLGQTPEQIGEIIVDASTSQTPHFRYMTSEMVQGLVARKNADPSGDTLVEFFASRLK